MLPLRNWPVSLRVSGIALALLSLHAVGLAVQLLIVQQRGGFSNYPDSTDSPAFESYAAQVFGGFGPGLAILFLGLALSVSDATRPDLEVAAWGRIIARGLGIVTVILIGLAFPLWGRGL